MKYIGHQDDVIKSTDATGVILVNLGTPDRPVCPSLRNYLSEFLMDPRVIEIPKLLRLILVKGIIINFRSHKSAAKYREVWTDSGSPLLVNSILLNDKVSSVMGDDYIIETAMRYGKPDITHKIIGLHKRGVRKLIILPLYPQYSGSTNGSTFDAISKTLHRIRWVPSLSFINSYHNHPSYIKAISESIALYWEQHGRAQKLIFSFHGVPKKYITSGDPYQSQCTETAHLVAKYLNLPNEAWVLAFQSRFGAQEWIQPYCDETLKSLPSQGVKTVDIICPGFSVDCLETLEEIVLENKEYFIQSGGENYNYIPCLNDSNSHVNIIADLIEQVNF